MPRAKYHHTTALETFELPEEPDGLDIQIVTLVDPFDRPCDGETVDRRSCELNVLLGISKCKQCHVVEPANTEQVVYERGGKKCRICGGNLNKLNRTGLCRPCYGKEYKRRNDDGERKR